MTPSLPRRLLAETLGTGLLVAVVIGSGIAAQKLSPDDTGLQLLENSLATVFGLGTLILLFGPISGAHFNPVVSAADWLLGRRDRNRTVTARDAAAYAAGPDRRRDPRARCWPTPCSTSHPCRSRSKVRATPGLWLGEIVATAGLIALDLHPGPHRACRAVRRRGRRLHRRRVLVHLAPRRSPTPRSASAGCSPTPSPGSRPPPCPASSIAQLVGAALGAGLVVLLHPDHRPIAAGDVVVPHDVSTTDR